VRNDSAIRERTMEWLKEDTLHAYRRSLITNTLSSANEDMLRMIVESVPGTELAHKAAAKLEALAE
jgi:hypothetical protein